MPLYTDGSRNGVPIAYNFTYGGNAVGWGTTSLMEMGDVSMRAEPLNGNFSVSELTTTFSDTNGSIWGSLGHGTSALGSSWAATVYIGGTMGEQGYGPGGTRLARLNTGNSGTYVIHTGRITEISRKNRQVEITSQNLMGQVADLEWRFPVNYNMIGWDAIYGTYLFQYGLNLTSTVFNKRPAMFNFDSTGDYFEVYGYVGSLSTLTSAYPTPMGRGTMGVITGSNFFYPGTQFYFDYNRVFFKGSYLATWYQPITTDEEAHTFGYSDLAAANAAVVSGTYILNRTRLALTDGNTPTFTGSYIALQQVLTLSETPAYLWQEMLTGCCVTPLFGSNTIDAVTLATARINTAFQSHQQRIDPRGGKVLPYIKNLLEPLRALWSVSSANTFRLYTFGQKTFADVLGTIGMNEVIDSEVTSSIDDKINRISIDYGYVFETGSYSKRLEIKSAGWGSANDFPFEVKSQWMSNNNDVRITAQRTLSRYAFGVPKMKLTVPFTRLSADVGSLFAVVDDDQYAAPKVFEVIGWSKNFSDSRDMTLSMLDGQALYLQRGYAKWEGDNNLEAPVSGTSKSGWGTNGTVHNINYPLYGSCFVWS